MNRMLAGHLRYVGAIALSAAVTATGCYVLANLEQLSDFAPNHATDSDASADALDESSGSSDDSDVRLDTATGRDAAEAGRDATVDHRAPDGALLCDYETSWCAQQSPTPTFCHDFSHNDPVYGFAKSSSYRSVPSLTNVDSTSSPCSLSVRVSALRDTEAGFCRLVDALDYYPRRIQVAFDFRIVALDPSKSADLTTIQLGSLGNNWSLWLRLQRTLATVIEVTTVTGNQPSPVAHDLTDVPGKNGWTRVTIDVDLANSRLQSVLFDGEDVLPDLEKSISPTYVPSGTTQFVFGADTVVGPSAPIEYYMDNIVVIAEK